MYPNSSQWFGNYFQTRVILPLFISGPGNFSFFKHFLDVFNSILLSHPLKGVKDKEGGCRKTVSRPERAWCSKKVHSSGVIWSWRGDKLWKDLYVFKFYFKAKGSGKPLNGFKLGEWLDFVCFSKGSHFWIKKW